MLDIKVVVSVTGTVDGNHELEPMIFSIGTDSVGIYLTRTMYSGSDIQLYSGFIAFARTGRCL